MADTLQKRGNFVQYQLFTQGKIYSKKYPSRFYDYCTLSYSELFQICTGKCDLEVKSRISSSPREVMNVVN